VDDGIEIWGGIKGGMWIKCCGRKDVGEGRQIRKAGNKRGLKG